MGVACYVIIEICGKKFVLSICGIIFLSRCQYQLNTFFINNLNVGVKNSGNRLKALAFSGSTENANDQ